jgi:hypothetical protein
VLTLPLFYVGLDRTPNLRYSGVVSKYLVAWEVFTGWQRVYYADRDAAIAHFVHLDRLGRSPYFYELEA